MEQSLTFVCFRGHSGSRVSGPSGPIDPTATWVPISRPINADRRFNQAITTSPGSRGRLVQSLVSAEAEGCRHAARLNEDNRLPDDSSENLTTLSPSLRIGDRKPDTMGNDMTLAKRAEVGSGRREGLGLTANAGDRSAGQADVQPKRARTFARQQKVAERVAAATAEMASAINESASAAQELSKSMEQIAAGAEEASGAAQQSL